MNRMYFLLILALSGIALLAQADTAQAQTTRGGYSRTPYFPPNRMPGWDWWRIYPYSPYNYGRNPYNPIIYPPYPYPPYYPPVYPSYPAAQPYYTNNYLNGPSAPTLQADTNQHVVIPHPTGEVRQPFPGTAIIQLRVPDQFAQVWFDGQKSSSIGYTRYYATPELTPGKTSSYTITARWNQDGKEMNAERKVQVTPGKTVHVDFTQ